MIEEDLLAKFATDNTTLLGDDDLAVSYNRTPEGAPATRMFFQRAETTYEPLLNGTPVVEHIVFDVECVSPDLATSMQLANAVRAMNTFTGTMGDTLVLACDVQEQSDEYVYHHDYADEGLAVDALRLELMV